MRIDLHARAGLAISLIRRGMRTSIVGQVTGVHPVVLRELHHEIHRRKPASGQLPSSSGVLRSPLIQASASAFASLLPSARPGGHPDGGRQPCGGRSARPVPGAGRGLGVRRRAGRAHRHQPCLDHRTRPDYGGRALPILPALPNPLCGCRFGEHAADLSSVRVAAGLPVNAQG